MATIRPAGAEGEHDEGVGPWQGLAAVIRAIDHDEEPGAQMRACLCFMTACIKNLSPQEMIEAMSFSVEEMRKKLVSG